MRRLKTVLHSCSTIWPLKIFSSVDVKTASTAKQLLTLLKRSQNPIVQKKTHTQPPILFRARNSLFSGFEFARSLFILFEDKEKLSQKNSERICPRLRSF